MKSRQNQTSRSRWNARTLFFLFSVVGCSVGLWYVHQSSIQSFSKESIEAQLETFGLWAPLIYMGLLAFSVVVSYVPGILLLCASGVVWGTSLASVYSVMGAFIGSLIAYGLGYFWGDTITKWLFKKKIKVPSHYGHLHLGCLIFITRLVPIFSFDLVSYGAGIMRLSFPLYAGGTLFGMIPSITVIVYMGEQFMMSNQLIVMGALGIYFLGSCVMIFGIRRYNWFNLQSTLNF